MKLLLLLPSYPHQGNALAGAPNAKTALVLAQMVERLVVVCPRPVVPRFFSFHPRWRSYRQIPAFSKESGFEVHRLGVPALPGMSSGVLALLRPKFAYHCVQGKISNLHRSHGFDRILSFDLSSCGELAWRIGCKLDLPACGWAIGSDMRVKPFSARGLALKRTLRRLDCVFYQSQELRNIAANLVNPTSSALFSKNHFVQSRGVLEPPTLPDIETRLRIRSQLGITPDVTVALYVGRVRKDKGIIDLVQAMIASGPTSNFILLIVGSVPAYDESKQLIETIQNNADLLRRVIIIPACDPSQVWDYYAASDIFVFPSLREGMPNSLLEAMLSGLPAVAFSIPPVIEINARMEIVTTVSPFNFDEFVMEIARLSASTTLRQENGLRARQAVKRHFSMHDSMSRVLDKLCLCCKA